MKSTGAGKRTSAEAEVLNVSPHGLWLLVRGEEHFLRYEDHPWFAKARIAELFHVELLHGTHLRWPDLDVDLHLDSAAGPAALPT